MEPKTRTPATRKKDGEEQSPAAFILPGRSGGVPGLGPDGPRQSERLVLSSLAAEQEAIRRTGGGFERSAPRSYPPHSPPFASADTRPVASRLLARRPETLRRCRLANKPAKIRRKPSCSPAAPTIRSRRVWPGSPRSTHPESLASSEGNLFTNSGSQRQDGEAAIP